MNNNPGIIISSALLLVTVLGLDCPYKECACIATDILCHNKELTEMPQKTVEENTFFTTLFLDRNQISIIPGRSLPANLTLISLTDNPLTTIVYTAFNEMADTLEKLTISNASFAQLPDAFLHLNALKHLHLYDSIVEDWNDAAMRHLGSTVENLALENVGLTSWPTWIQNYSRVTDLSISGNLISFVPDDGLNAMTNSLRNLILVNNSLTAVPQAVYKLNSLLILALEHNHISDLTWLPQALNLSFLSLNSNNISDVIQLSSALRVYGDSLYNLYLQDNHLTAVPDLDFLAHVVQLDLTNNLISDLNSGSLPPSLYELNLSSNALASIPLVTRTFQGQNKLVLTSNSINEVNGTDFSASTTELELGYNQIAELTDTSFPQNSKIIFLYLNNNPITKVSELAFLNLDHLYKLDLQYTSLTRLPLALSSLTAIVVFDTTGSADLVCTCQEKSLEHWVLSLAPGNVMGKCGDTSVYLFYETLSPDCP